MIRLEEIYNTILEAYKYLDQADDDLDIVCTENSSSNPKEIKALGELVAHFNTGRSKIRRLIKEMQNNED